MRTFSSLATIAAVAVLAMTSPKEVLAQMEEGYNPSHEFHQTLHKTLVAGDDYYKAWPKLLRKNVLALTSEVNVEQFFAWAEQEYPASFIKGPTTKQINFQGCTFDYRQYASDYYLGVCRGDQYVYSYSGGKLIKYDVTLESLKCQINPRLCAAAGFAGTVVLSKETDGVYATFRPNYVDGKLTWLGADGKGYNIPPSDVEATCTRSLRTGNWGKKTGFGCAAPQVNGELRVRVPNNDCSRFVFWSRSTGKELWLNLDDPKGWRVTGLNAKANTACGIEYGEGGFTPAKISAVQEADGTASLVWDFGSDFVNGFFARDGQSVVIDHPAKLYGFVLNGSHQGKDYGPGWGLGDGRKTASGDLIQPSIRMAWLESSNGKYFLKYRNLACADKVNVTVHSGSGPANNVTYATGPDGFGLGWAGLQYQASASAPVSQSMWTAGQGVVFDPLTGQVRYGVPFCKQP